MAPTRCALCDVLRCLRGAPLQVALRLRGAISSKQLGYEDLLAPLIAEACIDVVPANTHNFNVDNVRVVKIMGGALPDSQVRRWSRATLFNPYKSKKFKRESAEGLLRIDC